MGAISDWLSNWIIGVVTVVWVANFCLPLLVPAYHSDTAINGVFMSIVGGALVVKSRHRKPGQPAKPAGRHAASKSTKGRQ